MNAPGERAGNQLAYGELGMRGHPAMRSKSMLPYLSLMTLMADAARVIEIRLRMMALGQSTPGEIFLMVSEKMKAMEEAGAIIARGGNSSLVIANYQKIVAANVARLSGAQNV